MPFRVVARHPDPDHHDHAWAQVGGLYDYKDDAKDAAAVQATLEPNPQSLDPEEPVRPDQDRLVAEYSALGYERKVQELVTTKSDGDGEPIESRWKDVK
jgi:hypothetical protein